MKRGRYGKPYRPPADGWFVPQKMYFGGLYQHIRPALNNLLRFQNNTQVALQQNQIGRPVTRYAPDLSGPSSCEDHPDNGLPKGPWIGLGTNQGLPVVLGGNSSGLGYLGNSFQQNGVNSLGLAARLRGFKNVQAARSWNLRAEVL